MSFKKIQLIDPHSVGNPEDGHVYFGRDQYGYWEKDSNNIILRITSGITIGYGSSGISGNSGSSGVDGSFYGTSGTSGFSGSSGIDGTSGSSGKTGTHGTSGTSGIGTSGSSGSSGLSYYGSSGSSGYSGSSGVDGSFYGSSGTSGTSGVGGYGGSNRKWKFINNPSPSYGEFYCDSNNLTNIYIIKINQIDADGQLLDEWINSWLNGIFKIEKFGEPSIFGIYSISNGHTTNTIQMPDINIISGLTSFNANGLLQIGENYLISYVSDSYGTSGSSGVSGGSSGVSGGSSGVSGSSGLTGVSGSSGSSGLTGISGSSGVSGSSGSSGLTGISGSSGVSGSSGLTGISGTSGVSGSSGLNGEPLSAQNFELCLLRKSSGNSYKEISGPLNYPSMIECWTDNTKNEKIFTRTITYTDNLPVTIITTDEITGKISTKSIDYSSSIPKINEIVI